MIKNPFLTYGYNGPEYFCDRVDETRRLSSLLDKDIITSENGTYYIYDYFLYHWLQRR